MAGIPQNFQSISPVIANYDFVDIASGTGYVNFYAGNTVDKYLISNNTFYSDVIFVNGNTNDLNYHLVSDLDFDVTLNRPLDLNGLGIVNVPIGLSSLSAQRQVYAYVVVYVRKYDGSTETDIVSNTSREFTTTSAVGTTAYSMLTLDVACPITHFKKGETLRLTVASYAKTTNASQAASVSIGNDPKSRSTTWDSTGAVPSQLIFQCPVRLNL